MTSIVPAQDTAPARADGAPLELRGAQEGDHFGVSLASVGDVDGDGVLDLLVGANNYTSNAPWVGLAGRRTEEQARYAVLYSGKERRELVRIFAEEGAHGMNFGLSVLGAADADGDGRPDLAFGLLQSDLVTLMLSKKAGTSPGPSIELRSSKDGRLLWRSAGPAGQLSGLACALLDDHDGDGCRDIAVGGSGIDGNLPEVILHSGRTGARIGALLAPGNTCGFDQDFGESIASVGDLDGDGLRDVAVGYPGACRQDERSLGAVHAYSTKSGGLLRTWSGQHVWQHYGCAVAGLTDLDGDGLDELAIGARGEKERGPFSGAVYVISPVREAPLFRFVGKEHSEFGSTLGSAGDFDGDGTGDVWVGSAHDIDDPEKRGSTVVFSGKTGSELARSPGETAAALGDVNGDGCADLAIGSHSEEKARGIVRILLGRR